MNKKIAVVFFTGLISLSLAAREVSSLNFGWEFENTEGVKHMVDLPHDFQIEQPWVVPGADERPDNNDGAANIKSRLSSRGFKEMGKGIYRKTLFIPDSLKGKRVLLDFGGIMLVGDVYLNDERIGGTDYGYVGFECDITDKVHYGADNDLMVISDTGNPLDSRWYTGGGLYRDVNLVVTNQDLYFNRHGLLIETSDISDNNATVKISGDINTRLRDPYFIAEIEIKDPDGRTVVNDSVHVPIVAKWKNREYDIATFPIANPKLWDCDSPNLYSIDVTLRRADGAIVDNLSETFGIRTIEYSPDFGFKLNGKKVLLKGIANHHTLGALGAAAYPRAIEKRIQMLKDFGFNHIRTSHNPYSEDFLYLCDKYGILVVDELYDKWLQQYTGGRKDWTEQWQHDIPEWVTRDRNHPSVVMWSLGNELQGYSNLPFNDWGVTAYRLQKTLLDHYDTSRPVTVAMHPRVRDLATDSLPAPLVHETDIASYNYRYMYFPGDSKRFPDLIFYQSEANLSNMGPNFFVPDNDKVVGLAYWGMIDYLGESLGWPAKGWTDGVFDISLDPKPNAWFLKSMFVDDPVVKIAVANQGKLVDWNGVKIGGDRLSDSWNLTEGDTVKIYTYTNADEVVLLLNGREIGRKHNALDDPNSRNRILWTQVPYKPGVLTAVAYRDGKEVARDKIETVSAPVKIIAEIDNPAWKADGIDLQHVRVTAVDKKGRKCPQAENTLRFKVDGAARLVAVSNGDNTSEELNVIDTRRLYGGRALAILRSYPESGPVTLTIETDGLKPITLKLSTNE